MSNKKKVVINGSNGNGIILGTASADFIRGNNDNDTIEGGAGNDKIFGNAGIDTAIFSGSILDYSWVITQDDGESDGDHPDWFDGKVTITDLNTDDGDDGTDTLKHVERLQFNDYVFDVVGNNAPLLIAADSQVTDEDTSLTFSLSAFDFDSDAVTASIVAASGASVLETGSTSLTPNMGSGTEFTFSYDPGSLFQYLAAGETANDQVTIQVSDGNGGVSTKVIDFTITGVNDATADNNLGFELGDFTSWQTLGAVFIQAGGAPEGNYMAHLDSDGASESNIESFLGVGSSALNNIVNVPTFGAAIKTTLSLNAGDTVSFDWYFDGNDFFPYNDTSFFTSLNGNLSRLSDIATVGDFGDSGWNTSSFTVTLTGVYDFGFGVVNSLDAAIANNSSLYVDNITIS